MQISLHFARDGRLPELLSLLKASWPGREQGQCDPLSQLVFVLIGARTPGALALAAFHRVRQAHRHWTGVKTMAIADLVKLLAGVGDAERKARVIKNILAEIDRRHGALELDFLAKMSTGAARDFLESLPGVGPTASAATLNFSTLQRTVLSVTEETTRPIRRLGLVPDGAARSSLDRHIIERMPPEWQAQDLTALHQGFEKIARHFCHPGKPDCPACPIASLCSTASRGSGDVVAFGRNKEQ